VSALQSALDVGGRGREIYVLATCPSQFAKAGSAATLPQHEKAKLADAQQGRVNITGFICTVASKSPRRYTLGEFESILFTAVWFKKKHPGVTSGVMMRWCALPLRGPPRFRTAKGNFLFVFFF
jgi:hypothetical protein